MAKKSWRSGALRQKQSVTFKNVMDSPFQLKWPTLTSEVEEEVLKMLVSHLQGVQRTKHVGKDISPSQTSTDGEVEQLRQRYLSRRQAFVIGINEVTRLLEKDQLSLVLVNRGVKPLLLVEHLLPLACRQHCFAVAMNNLCERVGPLVGVKTVSAIGFKKLDVEAGLFDEVVQFIRKSTVNPSFPYTPNSQTETGSSSTQEITPTTHKRHRETTTTSAEVDIPYVKLSIKRVQITGKRHKTK